MDPGKHKIYAGSQVLGALVFLQAASIPEFVHSPGMLRFATHALFLYQLLLCLLICLPIFCQSPGAVRPRGSACGATNPKLLTLTNALTLLLTCVSVWAAWRACYRFWLMLAGAGLLLTLTVLLYCRNLCHWNFVQNNGAGE